MWDRQDVDFIQTQHLPWLTVPRGSFGEGGGLFRVLSTDDSDGAVTQIVRFRNSFRGVFASRCDIFVLKGYGRVNGAAFGPNDYIQVQSDTFIDLQSALPETVFYMGFWGRPEFDLDADGASDSLSLVKTEDMAWSLPEWSGERDLGSGVAVKWLRRDETGICFLSCMMPGWRCEDEEEHPVYEESFKVYGDILMGARGVMGPGAYFYRSPGRYHGPLYSRTGTMSFIRSDAPTSTTYRTPETGRSWSDLSKLAYADIRVPALDDAHP